MAVRSLLCHWEMFIKVALGGCYPRGTLVPTLWKSRPPREGFTSVPVPQQDLGRSVLL